MISGQYGIDVTACETAFGKVHADGSLGYDQGGITAGRVYLPHVDYTSVISAHAPSEVRIHVHEPVAIRPALNSSACLKPDNICRFWIDWHCVADLSMPGQVGPAIHLVPGRYRLRAAMDFNHGGHSLWLFSQSNLPARDRLAVCTLAYYPESLLYERLRWLHRSCAKFGMLLNVNGVGEMYGTHYDAKVDRLERWLASIAESYSAILFMDGADTFLLGNEVAIRNRIQSMGVTCIGAERCACPNGSDAWTSRFMKCENPYPQAGMWGGDRDHVLACLRGMRKLREDWRQGLVPELSEFKHWDDDQFLWQAYFLQGHQGLVLDVHSRCFANMTCANTDLNVRHRTLYYEDGGIVSSEGGYPLCVHFSGEGRERIQQWACMLGLG